MQCNICGNKENNQTFCVREMLFGYDQFTYFQCNQCNCLQIAEFPSDMTRYYPDDYYSISEHETVQSQAPAIPKWCHTLIGGPIVSTLHMPYLNGEGEKRLIKKALRFYLNDVHLSRQSSILDVGCGSGSFLRALRKIGFTNLLGIDLYIRNDVDYDDGVTVRKGTIADLDSTSEWDVITFHHSLEHMPDQLETLQKVAQLLSPTGVCLIRIPTVPSYAWEHYGVNWVGLDAPRHFYIHSVDSMRLLAEQARLHLQKVVHDSTSFQFWASEQRTRGIPIYSKNSFHPIFSQAEMLVFEQRAKLLNRQQRGDQAAFSILPNTQTCRLTST